MISETRDLLHSNEACFSSGKTMLSGKLNLRDSKKTCCFWKGNECVLELNLAGGIRLVRLGESSAPGRGDQRECVALPSHSRSGVRTLLHKSG